MNVTKLLTIPEFARATGLNYWLAWQLVRRGNIPSVAVGTRRRIDVRWIEQWLATGGYHAQLTDGPQRHGKPTQAV
jgi:excisionase family DNA binding protein